MPIPEPGLNAPRFLYTSDERGTRQATPEQYRQELHALYGAPKMESFSHEEIARMRQILAVVDSQQPDNSIIVDPNNPPKKPYKFQKFPLMVYDLAKSKGPTDKETFDARGQSTGIQHVFAKVVTRLVHNEHELQNALAKGWSKTAPVFHGQAKSDDSFDDESEVPTSEEPAPARLATKVPFLAVNPRRKGGRPKKKVAVPVLDPVSTS